MLCGQHLSSHFPLFENPHREQSNVRQQRSAARAITFATFDIDVNTEVDIGVDTNAADRSHNHQRLDPTDPATTIGPRVGGDRHLTSRSLRRLNDLARSQAGTGHEQQPVSEAGAGNPTPGDPLARPRHCQAWL